MRSDFDLVGDFHRKFGLESVTYDGAYRRNPPNELREFRLKFLREELRELEAAYADGDMTGVADALVDLVYVALGTAHVEGLPWAALMRCVHDANMKKERALRADQSTRGSKYDVIKPPGWEPPNVDKVLELLWQPRPEPVPLLSSQTPSDSFAQPASKLCIYGDGRCPAFAVVGEQYCPPHLADVRRQAQKG